MTVASSADAIDLHKHADNMQGKEMASRESIFRSKKHMDAMKRVVESALTNLQKFVDVYSYPSS